MIELKTLNKIYNKGKSNAFHALKDIDFTVSQGEMVAIMGPSGAGKSTLMHVIGTVDSFENGVYLFQGKNVGLMSEKRKAALRAKKIGFVLQDFGLISDETALSNVMTPLFFGKARLRDMKAKALLALKAVGIENLAKKKVKNLSGGQKQRVAIARAIVSDPVLLLADEPTGALDTKTSAEIMDIFANLHQKGKTILIVTHNDEVAAQCERTVQIVDGKIIE